MERSACIQRADAAPLEQPLRRVGAPVCCERALPPRRQRWLTLATLARDREPCSGMRRGGAFSLPGALLGNVEWGIAWRIWPEQAISARAVQQADLVPAAPTVAVYSPPRSCPGALLWHVEGTVAWRIRPG